MGGRFAKQLAWTTAPGRWLVDRLSGQSKATNQSAEPAEHLEDPLASIEVDPSELELADKMLGEGRFALLVRPQIAELLAPDCLRQAVEALDRQMAVVPAGQVVVGPIDEALEEGKIDSTLMAQHHAHLIEVDALFLDRYAVTNEQYQAFVNAGGYDEIAIWDEEIWPEVLEFVDRSGQPGPKNWEDGRFPTGQESLPVTGVSWYEARAYARWAGKRLPTDAEWVKAGGWPVSLTPDSWIQRKYPWGNSFDHQRANIWGSEPGGLTAVDRFATGISAGGVSQLIGNVWEWTSANFGSSENLRISLPVPMKSIRGGAYDTYFENQATCNFQSGENPISRKHNIGFRLALGVCDLDTEVARQLLLDGASESPVAEEMLV